ncbi:hypothetical protein H010_10201 [Hydrogenophaga taeniospiralis CCUG 15921]|uniref:Uncharacterized protein n=1 Tax=Hydrogenophaga taeniospiralis CCUG 15921 TaxID=1281780 RepID=A0A9X4NT43_9BURK|nr:hypothetical protein [Hydrogenophaga taeniospiralis]MDG5975624.1 hypothetical protein [Hydrogenophaga taeniospiralis CCUG 15921]
MPEFLMLGEHQIGILESTNVDHFWCYGRFKPGKNFGILAERLALLERAYFEAEAGSSSVDPDQLQDEINQLGLAVLSNGTAMQVQDFKLQGESYEYRVGTSDA